MQNLKQIANELTRRLLKLFEKDAKGTYNYQAADPSAPSFNDHPLFFEYFHGDTGQGLGASHQTGWTALIANLILEMEE